MVTRVVASRASPVTLGKTGLWERVSPRPVPPHKTPRAHTTENAPLADVAGSPEQPRGVRIVPPEAYELTGGKVDGAAIARAVGAIEIAGGHQFLHDWLVVQGFIEAGVAGLHLNLWDAMPESGLFLAWGGADLVAAQTAIPEGQDSSSFPSAGPFSIEIGNLRRRGGRLCELGMSAVTPAFQKSTLPAEMVRCCVAHAIATGCSQLIAAIDPWKAKQYAAWGFDVGRQIRVFSCEMPFPAVLVSLDLEGLPKTEIEREGFAGCLSLQDYFVDCSPYLRRLERWSVQAGNAFGNAEFLRELFVRRSDLLARCSQDELETIRRAWGRSLFDQAWPDLSIPPWPGGMPDSEPPPKPPVCVAPPRYPGPANRPWAQRGNLSPRSYLQGKEDSYAI